MDVEQQTIKNTEDIGKVVGAVDKLALTMQFEIERGKEERESIKSLVAEFKGLSDKIGAISVLNEKISEIQKDIAILQTNDKTCKEWRDKHDGAADAMKLAIKAMWTVCGAGVMSVLGFVLYLYFTNASPTVIRKIGSHEYMGQVISGD